jgi:hypothetical protein
MKFSIQVSGLLKTLEPAVACAITNAKREYPDAFKLNISTGDEAGDKLTASAHNGYVAVTSVGGDGDGSQYTCQTAGSATVKAVDLMNVLASFATDEKGGGGAEGHRSCLSSPSR